MTNSEFFSTCSAEAIQEAAKKLLSGHLIAFPTETVYGLGADATNESAVERIYEVKGRPTNHPLIVHVSSINKLEIWAQQIPDYAIDLAHSYWPGPMTLILKRTQVAKDFVTGSQDSIGIRVPSNPIALELLKQFESFGGLGIAAPSANRFGQVSPTSALDVFDEIGAYLSKTDRILKGGRSEVGIESTIIDVRNTAPRIIRPGAITSEMVNTSTKVPIITSVISDIRVSGMLEKHYAPKAKVIINKPPKPGQAFMALSYISTPAGVYRAASPSDVFEFARNLYAVMRKSDEDGFKELVIQVPVGNGIEEAILDRISKASKGRTLT